MKYIKSILLFALSFVTFTTLAQNVPQTSSPQVTNQVALPYAFAVYPNDLNYTRVWNPLIPITDATNPIFTLNPVPNASGAQYCRVSTSYVNGFGHIVETIKRGSLANSSNSNDIIIPYDDRQSLTKTAFLPYSAPVASQFQTDAFNQQVNYYSTKYPNEGITAFSQSISSHNNLIPTTNDYAAGVSFIGENNGTTTTTTFNNPSNPIQNIPIYSYSSNLTQNGYYAGGQLIVKTITEANGGTSYEFYDFDNRLICKKVLNTNADYLTTYYVYDDLGRLRLVIPPTDANNSSPDNSSAYHFTYNGRGDIVSKSVPDQAGNQTVVYDSLHRPILFQSPLMASQGKSKFKLYDDQNRVIIEGYFYDTHFFAPSVYQGWIQNPSSAPTTGTYALFNYLINGTGGANITSIQNCELDVINYYDMLPSGDPAFNSVTFDNSYSSDYLPAVNGVVIPVPSGITKGLLVASKVLVRDSSFSDITNKMIINTYFYDQQGQLIQTKTLNPWNLTNKDITTLQYNFNHQKVLEIYNYNDRSSSNKSTTKLVEKYTYDLNNDGRLLNTQFSPDNTGFRTLNAFTYDDLGRTKTKLMGGVENQTYDYTIRGQLSGINSDYTLNGNNPNNNINFGCTVNYDNGFSMPRVDGKISGMIWRGAGTAAAPRAYGYQYDKAGRLTEADYNEIDYVQVNNQIVSMGWNHNSTDFTMSNVSYDDNGNILSMKQMGTPNAAAPMLIDQLTYTYTDNQLKTVTDAIQTNFNLGDFTNGNCGSCKYLFDLDGNLQVDPNKQIQAAAYNEADQPVMVNFVNGNSIKYIYDGVGDLVYKKVTDVTKTNPDEYRYWGPFTYKDDLLQYMLHDEGRARYLADTLVFRFDYFVKDHLGNVRDVVTADQRNTMSYLATNELISAQAENLVFNNIDNIREDNPLPVSDNEKAVMLNGSTNTIGTSILLHTMAGDKFDINAQGYWDQQDPASGAQYYDDAGTLASALVSTLANGSPGASINEGTAISLTGAVNTGLSASLDAFQGMMDNATTPGVPRAYINYLMFDENMNLITSQSGSIQVSNVSGSWQPFGTGQSQSIVAAQNGYVVIFLSNAQTQNVYFDNMNVVVYSGRLLQEQNYYPYGLSINEGQTNNVLPNEYQYQGKALDNQLGLNWDDFGARQYDPQIGRFCSMDPASQYASPYVGMGNDPANLVDPTGAYSGTWSSVPNTLNGTSGGYVSNTDGSQYVNPMTAPDVGGSVVAVNALVYGNLRTFLSMDDLKEYAKKIEDNEKDTYRALWKKVTKNATASIKPLFKFYTQTSYYLSLDDAPALACVGAGCNVPVPTPKPGPAQVTGSGLQTYIKVMSIFQHYFPNTMGINVSGSLSAIGGYSGSLNAGIIGNEAGVFDSYGATYGNPAASAGAGIFWGYNYQHNPTFESYMGDGSSHVYNLGPVSFTVSDGKDNGGNTIWRTYQLNLGVSSNEFLPYSSYQYAPHTITQPIIHGVIPFTN